MTEFELQIRSVTIETTGYLSSLKDLICKLRRPASEKTNISAGMEVLVSASKPVHVIASGAIQARGTGELGGSRSLSPLPHGMYASTSSAEDASLRLPCILRTFCTLYRNAL
ncbi:hypothetical protein H109_01694 [Trichophyton interdigitale MR816]|uniref:Uncharacterized protein n=1 Tax=Trichophyton interdigitale (strain MR816) TaxID=1215338 RepID=A0A059JFD8_TRIIM|nr:hypothetical protein H101_07736 [Trichophyton interdigitale H6]KDB26514.1 hypothetical protein H109_01694 [Trichophyton interdigitale MR816]